MQRHGAIPSPVLSTLFGHGAVHTLDGDAHRQRKSLFLALVTPESVASLVACVAAAWEDTVVGWRAGREVVLFDEASRALTAGVRRWAGVPVETHDVVARHRDADGELLDPHTAAVELLNIIRPTVSVCWFVAYAGHALHRWPQHREPLRAGG